MGRIRPAEHARDRVLTDDELRAIWKAAESTPGPFGCCVRLLLLTATRRNEAARMAWSELDGNDWIIPGVRMKGGVEHVVPLSLPARDILKGVPRIGPYVFTGDGRTAMSGFSQRKRSLDEASGVTDWRLHDLRRTARSLISRAGVNTDVAERVLAHAIGGVRGTYDRHHYYDEKRRAFEALASLVERIVNPPADNVVPLRKEVPV
jgi:integrase